MLSEAMTFYGLHRDFKQAGYFPTAHHEHIFAALKTAVKQGKLVVLSGIVGCGKTTLLRRIQDDLRRENEIRVSKSVALAKDWVTIQTLVVALFHDLSSEREVQIPAQSEKRLAVFPIQIFIMVAGDGLTRALTYPNDVP